MRTAPVWKHYPPDAPPMTADQMRRQDRQVKMLQEAVDAQERRVHAWLQAPLTVVPAKATDPDAD